MAPARKARRVIRKSSYRRPMPIIDQTNKNPPRKILSYPGGIQMFRFYVGTAQTNLSVNRTALLNLLTVGVDGTATGRRVHLSLKIIRVKLYGPPSNLPSNATSTCSFTWIGEAAPGRVIDDTNVANTASFINTRPPKGSYADQWVSQGVSETTAMFKLTAPVDSVLDIYYMATCACDSSVAHSTCITTANQTNGVFYYNNLDGTAGGVLPVVTLNRIT